MLSHQKERTLFFVIEWKEINGGRKMVTRIKENSGTIWLNDCISYFGISKQCSMIDPFLGHSSEKSHSRMERINYILSRSMCLFGKQRRIRRKTVNMLNGILKFHVIRHTFIRIRSCCAKFVFFCHFSYVCVFVWVRCVRCRFSFSVFALHQWHD